MHKSVAVGFGFNSDWVKKWYKFFKPNIKPSNAEPVIFSTQVKSAWIRNSSKAFPVYSSIVCGASEERIQQPDYNVHYPQVVVRHHCCILAGLDTNSGQLDIGQ